MGSLAVNESARGEYDPPMYVLFKHGAFNSSDEQVIALGINNLGECVGLQRADGDTGESIAYLWLPFAAYGEAPGIYNIETLTSMSSPGGSSSAGVFYGTVAFDINDAGVVAGRAWDSTAGIDAALWDIDASSWTLINDRVNAFAINNDSPAKLAGGSADYWEYLFSFIPSVPDTSASFIYTIGSGASDLDVVSGFQGVALGISDTTTSFAARVSGFGDCVGIGCPNAICNGDFNGLYWDNHGNNAVELEAYAEVSGQSAFVAGLAVNDDDDEENGPVVVGFGHDGVDNGQCRWYGLAWRDGPSSAPDPLPLLVSESSHREMALDVRDSQPDGSIDVVGRNITLGKAMGWHFDGTSTWSSIDLSGADTDVIQDLRGFEILECATGINDNGWITVWGRLDDEEVIYRSGVLIPYDYYHTEVCPGDLAGSGVQHPDGLVNVFDLFVLLANFDENELGADLAAPTNVVDVNDLFVLLANWNCRIGDIAEANTLEEEVTGAGLTMDDWDDFSDVMQYSESETEKSNYKCWMMNYLSGCSTCPPCIGNDPFDPRE